MAQYLLLLGTTVDICLAEAKAVTARFSFGKVSTLPEIKELAWLETERELNFEELNLLQNTLGGTVKLAEVFAQSDSLLNEAELEARAVEFLLPETVHRFAIAEFGRNHLPAVDTTEIKRALQKTGKRMNYVEASRQGASAAQLKRATSELWIVQTESTQYFAWSRTVQDIDSWSFRDVGKPVRERKRGMLPPKIARMMLNLALAQRESVKEVVLDPFVGTGTILIEATVLGIPNVLGSDLDQQAIYASNQNLTWWKNESELEFSFELVRKEIAHLQKNDLHPAPTLIVTEPFLGKLTPSPDQIPNVVRGLEKLYKGMVKTFAQVLPEGGRVAVILPTFRLKNRDIAMQNTLDAFEKQGFVLEQGPFIVGHPDAVTQRTVYVLEYMPYGSR